MSSSDRRTFLIALGASFGALSACGFTPTYAPGGAGNALRGKVVVDAPDTRDSYNLTKHLRLAFGTPDAPAYRLSYSISTRLEAIGITRDQEITRRHVVGTVTYRLRDIATDAAIVSGKASSFTAYSTTGSSVSAITAPRDASERLMTVLGDQMVSQILAEFGSRP
nr:hypothetical protein [uncultured Celeribacter sp.]